MGHRDEVRGVAVHDDAVKRVFREALGVAKQMGRGFRGRAAAGFVAPEEAKGMGIFDADDAEVRLGVLLAVLEIFAGAGDHEILADEGRKVAIGIGEGAEVAIKRADLGDFFFGGDIGKVSAVPFIPAMVVKMAQDVRDLFNEFHDLVSGSLYTGTL